MQRASDDGKNMMESPPTESVKNFFQKLLLPWFITRQTVLQNLIALYKPLLFLHQLCIWFGHPDKYYSNTASYTGF